MERILEIRNVSKSYSKRPIIHQVSMTVCRGECIGILGNNGSGKSTLMSIVAGMTAADEGEIYYKGTRISKKDRYEIGYVPQAPNLLEELTVADNIKLWKNVYKINKKIDVYQMIPDFLKIQPILKEKVSNISLGLRKKVSIAIVLMNQPELLILDEAFAALDAETSNGFKRYLKENPQISCIYTSHIVHEMEELCHSFYLIEDGVMRQIEAIEEYVTRNGQIRG